MGPSPAVLAGKWLALSLLSAPGLFALMERLCLTWVLQMHQRVMPTLPLSGAVLPPGRALRQLPSIGAHAGFLLLLSFDHLEL